MTDSLLQRAREQLIPWGYGLLGRRMLILHGQGRVSFDDQIAVAREVVEDMVNGEEWLRAAMMNQTIQSGGVICPVTEWRDMVDTLSRELVHARPLSPVWTGVVQVEIEDCDATILCVEDADHHYPPPYA